MERRRLALIAMALLAVGVTASSATPATNAAGPNNTSPPVVSGAMTVGATLSATAGVWSGKPSTYSFSWERCSLPSSCATLPGQTGSTYVLGSADLGFAMRVRVTATNKFGSATAFSALTGAVAAPAALTPPLNTSAPTISGQTVVGSTLTAQTGSWSGTTPMTYSYAWDRCTATAGCTAIAGATSSTYIIASADVGYTVRVGVLATNAAGSASAASGLTAVVTAPDVAPPGSSAYPVNDATTGAGTNQFEFGAWWTAEADASAHLGDAHYSNVAGNSYVVRFSGTQFKIYTTKDPRHGIQGVSIDGGSETMVDLYAPTRANQVLTYTSPLLPDGPHTLKVRVTGTKNTSASGTFIVADRVDVTSSASAPPPADNGWTNVIDTDFASDGVLPAPWKAYNFANSLPGGGYYLASHVVVSGGIVNLVQKYEWSGPARNPYYTSNGAGWYQGTIYAAGSGPWISVDHRTTVRMRVISNGVTSHRGLPMWWPESGNAPIDGEEDFFESDGVWWPPIGGKEQPRSFFHYGASNSQVYWIWNPIDLSQWHTYRFERKAHKITIWVDDLTTPVWSQQYSSTELPDTPKHPIFQQENPNYLPPPGTTGSDEIQIDWIKVDTPS